MNPPVLALDGVVAGWQGPATRPVDLRLATGGIVGLSGANGAGKSTLLAAIAGRARVFGGRLAVAPGIRISLQTQEATPLAGLPSWLAGCLDRRLDRLSGGQRHYLALWAVLQAPADLLLLDEPTNNLDAAGVVHLGLALRQRAAAGCAILVVSHDAAFLAAACDAVIRLEAPDVP
ncbi:ATP-binding cassette domain-containing protein [Azonexus caeni]|uniref:ATP-binding cassette domain-containing protein n=1 Tax=Azonexus caeni TaxID=266126 RepID=UPI003A83654F